MSAEELKRKDSPNPLSQLKEKENNESPTISLQNSIGGLSKYGGFNLIKGLIKGADNMDPKRKAVKSIFLQDSAYTEERQKLKSQLELWLSILNKDETDPIKIVDTCKDNKALAEKLLTDNLAAIHNEIRKLEVVYRTVDSFFANAGQGKVDCITLMNVSKEELGDNDSEDAVAVREELEKYYDRLSLKKNYSLLVIPGYLGDADNVRKWADTAYRNKVILLTDFEDLPEFDMLKHKLDEANLQGQDVQLANVVMTCNYLLGRRKSPLDNEEEDVYIPGSAALAGRMTNTDEIVIAQGAAGKKFGTLSNIKGARLELRKSEIAALIDDGVVPMVEDDGRTMAFSNRSLYNGATIGLQEYPIVRVFDWIGKVFQNFFNDEAFINWNSQVKQELQQTIHDFLSDYKGPGKLIENYNLKGINQDPKTKDISIQVELKPFFAAKNFLIELTGHNGQAGVDWDQNIK